MSEYDVGVAERDITPPDAWIRAGRMYLWGYGSRTEPCEGVRDPLAVRALVVRDQAGGAIALVSADLGAIDLAMTESVSARASRSCSIPPENICISVTHTHGAPVPVNIPTWQPGFTTPDPEYLRLVEDQIVAAIEDASHLARPATISFARGETQIAFDRHFGGYPLGAGLHDPTLDVLRIVGADERVIAILFSTACHSVCLTALNQVYDDFPGVAGRAIERRFGGTALFVQGFTGISNPKVRDPDVTGKPLAQDVIALAEGEMETLRGPVGGRLSGVDLPFQPLPDESMRERARGAGGIYARWDEWITTLGQRVSAALPTQLQTLRIGEGPGAWLLAASSHEVTGDFGPPIRAMRPEYRVTTAGFCNSQFSYLPSRRVLAEPVPCDAFPFCENYEGGISFAWYGHRAPLTPDVDERYLAAWRALLGPGGRM